MKSAIVCQFCGIHSDRLIRHASRHGSRGPVVNDAADVAPYDNGIETELFLWPAPFSASLCLPTFRAVSDVQSPSTTSGVLLSCTSNTESVPIAQLFWRNT